jgi:chromosome partitioning protein
MPTIALVNEKGGVGKTPSVVNLGFGLARAGHRVLLIDADPQGSLTKYLLEDFRDLDHTLYHALVDGVKVEPVVINDHLSLLPAVNGVQPLVNADVEMQQKYRYDFQKRLRKVIRANYKDKADYIIIDTPGNVSTFTVLALAAADLAIIPVKTELSAEQATEDILEAISDVRGEAGDDEGLNPSLKIWGILPTLYEKSTRHHKEIVEVLKMKHGKLVYEEPSRKSNQYNNAHALRSDVSVLDPDLGAYWDRIVASILEGRD